MNLYYKKIRKRNYNLTIQMCYIIPDINLVRSRVQISDNSVKLTKSIKTVIERFMSFFGTRVYLSCLKQKMNSKQCMYDTSKEF
jgi:hypothetical protein